MTQSSAIKAELGVLVPVYEKDASGAFVYMKDKAGNILKNNAGKPVKKVSEFNFENFHFHQHIPAEKRIKLSDPLLVARMFRDFTNNGAKISKYAIFLPASGKGDNGDWQLLTLEEAIKMVESGERELVIDTQKHGNVKEGEGIYRERKLRLKLRLTKAKKEKAVVDADDYFDVAAFYTDKAKKK